MERTKRFYSSYRNPKLIHQATIEVLDGNFKSLLKYIYDPNGHTGILGHPEVRIGLVVKLLHNTHQTFDEELLNPVLKDIEFLMNNEEYLEQSGDSKRREKCLQEEYMFVQKYLDLDETITLNTEFKDPPPPITPKVKSNGGGVLGIGIGGGSGSGGGDEGGGFNSNLLETPSEKTSFTQYDRYQKEMEDQGCSIM